MYGKLLLAFRLLKQLLTYPQEFLLASGEGWAYSWILIMVLPSIRLDFYD